MKLPLLLGAKAETVFGALLVVRNRAVRLACGLALTTGVLLSLQEADRFPGAHQPRIVFLIAGTLTAVAGSRLFAPGGALAASRQVATTWWLVPLGRLTGALLAVLPVVVVPVIAMELTETDPLLLGFSVVMFGAAVASFSFSLAPIVGSSAAMAAAVASVWIGALPTAAAHQWIDKWPVAKKAMVLLWNTLPLPWRADRLFTESSSVDVLVLGGWIVVGFVVASWASTAAWTRRRRYGGRI
jgi:hypothetical protein